MKKNFSGVWAALGAGFVALNLAACASLPSPELPQKINTDAGGLGSYLQGAVAELGGNYSTAQKAYLFTLAEDPENLPLRMRVFQMSLLEGDVATAVRLAKTFPADLQAQAMPQLTLATDSLRRNDLAATKEHIGRAGTMAPQLLHFVVMKDYLALAEGQSPTVVIESLKNLPVPPGMLARRAYHVGRMYLKAGQPALARKALEEAETLEPGTVFTTRLLGELYERDGDAGRAAQVYSLFRQRNPSVPLFGGAIERLKTGTKPAPFASTVQQDVAEVMFDFGLLVWVQGADGPARQVMNLTLALNDNADPYALYYAALIGESGDQSGLSRARYGQLLNGELRVAAGVRLAQMDFADGKKKEAVARLRELMANETDRMAVERALADMLFADKDFAGALPHYQKLVEVVPAAGAAVNPLQQEALLFAYGATLERLKRYDDAAVALKKALQIDPANAQILNYLGYMWLEHGQHLDEAFELLKRANLLAPTDGAITDSLGWAYHLRGKDDVALTYLEKAAEQEPNDATVNEHLGDLYAKVGRNEEALRQWRLALQLAEDDEQKARVQAKLKSNKSNQ